MTAVRVPASEIDAAAMHAYADPAGEPWAMPLVVRTDPQAVHDDALAAAAAACVTLLDRAAASSGSTLADAVGRWRSGRIRKVTRRAKPGAAWQRALAADDGHVVSQTGTATVAAFTPTPVSVLPPDLARLQVTGLLLPAGGTPVPAPVEIACSPYLQLTTGKAVAQVCHSAQLLYQTANQDRLEQWRSCGFAVRIVTPNEDDWHDAVAHAEVVARDAGFTEDLPAGVRTTCARFTGQRP